MVLEAGQVRVPESFHAAYGHYCEGGWESLPIDQEAGGQGFPSVIYCSTMELFVAGLGLQIARDQEREYREEGA